MPMLEICAAVTALAAAGTFLLEFLDRYEIRKRSRKMSGRKGVKGRSKK